MPLLVAAILLHLMAAHFSVGAYHPDEHFQLLEFLGSKLGITDASMLPWEYSARLRPWLPVAFLRAVAGGWRALGIENPFIWTESFRFLAAALAGYASWRLYRNLRETDPEFARGTAIGFVFLWFIPFLHVRVSSEALAATFFGLGLSLLWPAAERKERLGFWSAVLGGICLGIAFECRFQMGIMIGGLAAWLIGRRVSRREFLLYPLIGFALAFAAGRFADRWGYGEWTLTPWNYLRMNLLENKAADWGTLPIWGYLYLIGRVVFPLGVLALLASVVFWWRQPRHVLTWVTLPFFLVHSLIGHKEARFLLPVAWILPMMIPYALKGIERRMPRQLLRGLAIGFATTNIGALLWLCLTPAQPSALFWSRVYDRFPDGLRYAPDAGDPYEWVQLPVKFYKPRGPVEAHPQAQLVYVRGHAHRDCPTLIDSLSGTERVFLTQSRLEKRQDPALIACP